MKMGTNIHKCIGYWQVEAWHKFGLDQESCNAKPCMLNGKTSVKCSNKIHCNINRMERDDIGIHDIK